MKTVTLKQQHDDIATIAGQSHMLWLRVNTSIARVIARGIRGHWGRRRIAARLNAIAGCKHKGEPVSLMNFRTAARQVLAGEHISVL